MGKSATIDAGPARSRPVRVVENVGFARRPPLERAGAAGTRTPPAVPAKVACSTPRGASRFRRAKSKSIGDRLIETRVGLSRAAPERAALG